MGPGLYRVDAEVRTSIMKPSAGVVIVLPMEDVLLFQLASEFGCSL